MRRRRRGVYFVCCDVSMIVAVMRCEDGLRSQRFRFQHNLEGY